jgi:hypothetical protein
MADRSAPLPFDPAQWDLRMNRAVARFTNSEAPATAKEPAGRRRYKFKDKFNGGRPTLAAIARRPSGQFTQR